jgi:putative oxidoreductase
MNVGRLVARIAIGGLFAGHGTQKLFGWWGGPGIEGASQMMGKLELHPPKRNAVAAGASETAAGVLLALGALTPLAASLVTSTMITAIRKVHGQNGPWNMQKGYEYNLVLIAAAAALVDCGPGAPSVDRALGIEAKGTRWALASLAAGAAGSTLAIEAGRRMAERAKADEEQQEQQEQQEKRADRFARNGHPAEAEKLSPAA